MASPNPRVVMLHVGRCGSTVVAELLDQHSQISWDGEIYEPVIREKLPEGGLDPKELLQVRAARASHAYGFEVKYLPSHHQRILEMSLDDLMEMFSAGGVTQYITLHRRNLLRRVVSGAVGRTRKRWHRKGDEDQPSTTIELDVDSIPFGPRKPLLTVFAELEQGEEYLATRLDGLASLHLTYEDDVEKDPSSAYQSICQFVGLVPEPVETTLRPTGDRPLSEMISNYEQVAELLTGTEYEWMLDL